MRRVAVDGCASNLLLNAEALTDHTRGRIFPEELARSQAAVEVHFGSRLVPTLELSLILLHMEFLTRSRIASPFSYTWTPTTLFGALQAI